MFIAKQVSKEVILALREPVRVLRRRDRALATQLVNAANSASLNLAEGGPRAGKDQPQLYRIAAGSVAEVRAALDVGEAWGYFDGIDLSTARALLDRQAALLYRLINPRR